MRSQPFKSRISEIRKPSLIIAVTSNRGPNRWSNKESCRWRMAGAAGSDVTRKLCARRLSNCNTPTRHKRAGKGESIAHSAGRSGERPCFHRVFFAKGGRPRLFGAVFLAAAIHAGGRPRRLPFPSQAAQGSELPPRSDLAAV